MAQAMYRFLEQNRYPKGRRYCDKFRGASVTRKIGVAEWHYMLEASHGLHTRPQMMSWIEKCWKLMRASDSCVKSDITLVASAEEHASSKQIAPRRVPIRILPVSNERGTDQNQVASIYPMI